MKKSLLKNIALEFLTFWIFSPYSWVAVFTGKVLKHFRYFQAILVLQKNNTNSTHLFHIENFTILLRHRFFSFLLAQPFLKAWTTGVRFLTEVFYLHSDKSKLLAVCNGRVEQNWKWVSSYMQDWGVCKVRRVGLEPGACISFFYLYL